MNTIYSLEKFNFVSRLFINNLEIIISDHSTLNYTMGVNYINWLKQSIHLSLEFSILYAESIQFDISAYNKKYFKMNLLRFLSEELKNFTFEKNSGFFINYSNQKNLFENNFPLEMYFQVITENILKKYDSPSISPSVILEKYKYAISEIILNIIQPTYLMKHTLEKLTHDIILEI